LEISKKGMSLFRSAANGRRRSDPKRSEQSRARQGTLTPLFCGLKIVLAGSLVEFQNPFMNGGER